MNVLDVVLKLFVDILRVDIPDYRNNQESDEDELGIDLQIVNGRGQVVLIECVSKHAEVLGQGLGGRSD